MQSTDIQLLAKQLEHATKSPVRVEETGISWVLLTKTLVYKIKKPLRTSFLDFSTLERRHHYCDRELTLNGRFAPWIYLDVVPVRNQDGQLSIDIPSDGAIVDYAVKMRRLPSGRRMDRWLKKEQLEPITLRQLAEQLADFHRKNQIELPEVSIEDALADFADIRTAASPLEKHLGNSVHAVLEKSIALAQQVLQQCAPRLQERNEMGFFVDGHGDLHCGNVFVLERPLLFDCIEYSDRWRQIDVLSEVAFLHMDLAAHGRPDLASAFLRAYRENYPCMCTASDRMLYQFFLLYRANVRLKVHALSDKDQPEFSTKVHSDIRRYYRLLQRYTQQLKLALRVSPNSVFI